MIDHPRDDRPSLGVVLVGGVGVLAVLAFVTAIALGGRTVVHPGDRVAVVEGPGPAGATVLADRCLDQRVTDIAVSSVAGGGTGASAGTGVVWHIESTKGSIERVYRLGGPPPDGFTTPVPLASTPSGRVQVAITFTRLDHPKTVDARVVDLDDLPPASSQPVVAGAPAPCGGRTHLGFTTVLFGLGALVVVITYAGVVRRRWRP
jgi:hypothetical protein